MSRFDLHIHTDHSDGTGSVGKVLAEAVNKQLHGLAITDHNEIIGAQEASRRGPKLGLEIIIGEEISSTSGHILGLFISEKIDRGLSPEETVALIHRQGGLAIIPHPFPHYKGIGRAVFERLLASPDPAVRPDAIETRNGFPPQLVFYQQLKKLNSRLWNLPEIGGSDSHSPGAVGSCWTEFDGTSPEDLRRAILGHATRTGGSGWSVFETARVVGRDATLHVRRRFQRDS